MIIEACIETLEEALLAESRGAHRVELCADLAQGGLTPSYDLIQETVERLSIPVKVMIRPRGGDFVYTGEEVEEMLKSIAYCKKIKASGVVFGALDRSNELNLMLIETLSMAALPLEVTIHKAIDLTSDPVAAVKSLIKIPGIHSVLTSGKSPTAQEGIPILREMIALSDGQLEIVVAGKVTDQNISFLHEELGARAYHGRKIVGEF
jgi:copper homeostasis protein